MKNFLYKLDINKKLGITAFALGLVAVFGADPYSHTFRTINTKDIAYITEKKSNKIEPAELAKWIIEAKADFKLVDLRAEKEFNEYHIPGALNIKATEFEASGFRKPEKIVLYSDNDMKAAESWFLLKAKDYKSVYILSDGLNGWKDKVLFPKISPNASKEELASFEKTKEVSKYFGGVPQTGLQDESVKSNQTMPKLQTPSAQSAQSKSPRKKKEGC